MCILDVHDLIADVVCGFDEIHEGVAYVVYGAVGCGETGDSEFAGYALVVVCFAAEESELEFVACEVGGVGVLDDAGQGAVGHDEASFPSSLEVVCEQSEGIGIAFEVYEVVPLPGADAVACLGAGVVAQELSASFAEVGSDGSLSAVSEGWVAEVVGETGGADDAAKFGEVCAVEFGASSEDEPADVVSEAASYATYFEAVGESVVDEDAAGQREDLRLVLQAAEWCGEDEPVVVALEFGSVIAASLHVFLSEPFAGEALFPFHFVASGL